MSNKTPSRDITIEIEGNEYSIKFPNNGQLLDIESKKILISNDTMSGLLHSTSLTGQAAYLLVEAISVFSVLLKDDDRFQKDMNVGSLLDLDLIQSKSLIDAYKDVYSPWMSSWMKYLYEGK